MALLGLHSAVRFMPHEGADGVLHVPLLHSQPAVLNGHFLPVVVGEGEVRVIVDDLPDKLDAAGVSALGDDVGAVVAHHQGSVLLGGFTMVHPAAAHNFHRAFRLDVLRQLFAGLRIVLFNLTSGIK